MRQHNNKDYLSNPFSRGNQNWKLVLHMIAETDGKNPALWSFLSGLNSQDSNGIFFDNLAQIKAGSNIQSYQDQIYLLINLLLKQMRFSESCTFVLRLSLPNSTLWHIYSAKAAPDFKKWGKVKYLRENSVMTLRRLAEAKCWAYGDCELSNIACTVYREFIRFDCYLLKFQTSLLYSLRWNFIVKKVLLYKILRTVSFWDPESSLKLKCADTDLRLYLLLYTSFLRNLHSQDEHSHLHNSLIIIILFTLNEILEMRTKNFVVWPTRQAVPLKVLFSN